MTCSGSLYTRKPVQSRCVILRKCKCTHKWNATLRYRARGLLVRALARRDEDFDRHDQQVHPYDARLAGHQPDHVQVRSRSLLHITVHLDLAVAHCSLIAHL